MCEVAQSGGTPIELDLPSPALNRILAIINMRSSLGFDIPPNALYANINRTEFKHIYDFSVTYGFKNIKRALDVLMADCLNAIAKIKALSSVPPTRAFSSYSNYNPSNKPRIPKIQLEQLTKLLTSVPFTLMGLVKVSEAMDPTWIVPFLRAAYGNDGQVNIEPQIDDQKFAKVFSEQFYVCDY